MPTETQLESIYNDESRLFRDHGSNIFFDGSLALCNEVLEISSQRPFGPSAFEQSSFQPELYPGLNSVSDFSTSPDDSNTLCIAPTSLSWTQQGRSLGLAPTPQNRSFDSVHSNNGEPSLSSKDLHNYLSDASEQAELVCADCKRGFPKWTDLEKHGREDQHLPFRCPVWGCNKPLARRDTLTRHRRLHKSIQGHECAMCKEIGQPRFFKRMEHLRQHERRCHHPEKEKLRRMVNTLHPVLLADVDNEKMQQRIDALTPSARKSCLKELRNI